MIKIYIKTAWRNLVRNKGFMFVNLLGLSISMSATLLILLWVRDELTYDRFHKNYDNIHMVVANRDFKNRVFTDYNMVLPMARELQHAGPQIKNATVTTQGYDLLLNVNDAKLRKEGMTVGDHFFDIFSWTFLRGNPAQALLDPASIVLTQSAAKALFGNADPVNKTIRIAEEKRDVKVTAVVADPPGNSAFQFDFLRPFNYNDPDTKQMMENWNGSSWRVYVQTTPGADMKQVDRIIDRVKKQHDPGDRISSYFTFPMKRWHLYDEFKEGKNVGGMIEYVRLFIIIAGIILLIACVNFMNLSTARSERRSREVGIRKTLGSSKLKLVLQFFSESMLLVLIAFAVAVGMVLLLLPFFNQLVNKELTLEFGEPAFWLGSLAIIIITGILAGSYPALYLSSFRPVKVLKGVFVSGRKTALPRHILVVFQFVISMLLISATVIVYQQIRHIKDRKTGYDAHNLVMITGTEETEKNFEVIKQELLQSRAVSSVTRSSSPITQIWWKSGAPDWNGKPADLNVIISGIRTDVDFTKTMGIDILQGHDFAGRPSDSASVLLNKAAVEAMNLEHPIGMEMRFGDEKYNVIGVTGNVIMESPFQPVDPMLTFYNPRSTGVISLRIADKMPLRNALSSIEGVFKKYNPAYPFEYQFADAEFGRKFMGEELISRVTNIFAGLAIFICCMGLGGLAAYTVEKRFREIGIRKVLGATISQVLLLISHEFLKLVLIAFVIAVPLTWWLMHQWLEKYTYHIDISILVFAAVGVMVLLLALIVVGLNTLRAAVANPVRSLRTE
ncbi:ABC transporter permease [Niabella beijingensis]|uniref:ABC transporter permease n=1 Tax=Niabella beijingensis TaxID=2872700 RepID=UPI001CBFBFD5|nr:ABC transporter permease [Niabella beijingensis]MBZ4191473.1 ABC transporter permease [Niabella beijingensis]